MMFFSIFETARKFHFFNEDLKVTVSKIRLNWLTLKINRKILNAVMKIQHSHSFE